MFTVIAVWQNAEVGIGHGDSLEWAMADCREDCPPFLTHRMDDVDAVVMEDDAIRHPLGKFGVLARALKMQ